MRFRIGVDVGDVMVKDDLFGDGVNVAARLEGLVKGGEICASRGVHDHLRHRDGIVFEDLGEQPVKNIAPPIRAFRLRIGDDTSQQEIATLRNLNRRPLRRRSPNCPPITRSLSSSRFAIGAMVTGAGGIGNESIDTLLKDLRRRFSGEDEARRDWTLDPAHYTLAQVANRLRTFLFEEKAAAYAGEVWTRVRLCGYSAGPPARRGLGDTAARAQLTGTNPGARRAGFRHPVGRGIRGTEPSDLWAWDRLRGRGRRRRAHA